MTIKEQIIKTLSNGDAMTQGQLAESIYNDKNHIQNIYSTLMILVDNNIVFRSGSRPSYYSLTSNKSIPKTPTKSTKKSIRNMNKDIITNETIEQIDKIVLNTENYGAEIELITRCLYKFPNNTDPDIIAMKIGLIDITNSTHLSQHKNKINMYELAQIISNISNIDERIANGDPEVVNEIAKSNGKINLFSFATKYCCYHNYNYYGKDDYSILDKILKTYLPKYFNDITESQIEKWRTNFQYKEYNNYITSKLDELNITLEGRKRKFDHFIWYKNR